MNKKAEEILIKHCMSMSDEFLGTDKQRRFKQGVLDAMEEYKSGERSVSPAKNSLKQEASLNNTMSHFKKGES